MRYLLLLVVFVSGCAPGAMELRRSGAESPADRQYATMDEPSSAVDTMSVLPPASDAVPFIDEDGDGINDRYMVHWQRQGQEKRRLVNEDPTTVNPLPEECGCTVSEPGGK